MPPEYLKILERQNQNRQTGETGVYEMPLIKKNGERIWALISGAPVIDMDGNMTGSIGIHYDITRQKNLQRELEEARQRAEAAQEAEKQFLANMSHEIRTPLNAIIGMSYLLYDTKPTQEQLELLEILKSSADILRTLINDVLDLSKVRAGKIELQQNEFDLVGLVKALLKSVELRLHDRPIRVVSDIDPGIVHTVIGDDLLLNQVLLNLLGNAEKFTEKGEIGISVRRLATPPDAPDNTILLQFQVFDTGIGIPEDKQQVIFQDFRQVDGDIKRRYGGTGLGLSITKKLVEAQGGTISVHSQDNKGTVFTVVLAYQDSGRVKKMQAQAEAEEQFTGRPSKILVAEDNPMNRLYVGTLLQKWGMEFVMAYNGREAVARSQEERFDLVLMDIQMPEMDGYEACLAIRNAHNPNQHTPMIALTASAMNSKKDKAFEVGMNDYLSKPFQPAQLLEKLNRFLHRDFDQASVRTRVTHTFEFNALLDQHTLRELYADDWGYAFEMFGMFLRYGLKELELMPELLEASDWEALHRLAHKVKPTLGMVGAPDLEKQFELLEMTAKSAPEKEHIQTLLIVDDAPEMGRFLALFLSNRFQTVVCTSAEEALQRLDGGFRPDAMVIDRDLPGTSGLALMQMVQSRGLAIPTMMLSEHPESKVRIEALGRGAEDFMCKPFHPAELALRLGKMTHKKAEPSNTTPLVPHLTFAQRLMRAAAIL